MIQGTIDLILGGDLDHPADFQSTEAVIVL